MSAGDLDAIQKLFLLTPLREGRPDHDNARRAYRHISTHAPAGGATTYLLSVNTKFFLFLLTPLREGRLQSPATVCRDTTFLLTPLREGRHVRGRSGRDPEAISTHAPAGGATNDCDLLARRCRISTHAPAGGATAKAWAVVDELMISTHAPAGGATVCKVCGAKNRRKFLLTPLREGRHV